MFYKNFLVERFALGPEDKLIMATKTRPSKKQYFMAIAEVVATRSTCDRASVGAILVQGDHIIATGYNGAPSGLDHCSDVGHDIEDNHCVRVVHGEENAIIQAALYGVSTKGATCFCTTRPCFNCTKLLYSAGIGTVVFKDEYASMSSKDLVRLLEYIQNGMKFYRLNEDRLSLVV